MSYIKDSIESIKETRHSQIMGEVLRVANQWVSPGIPGNSEVVLLGDDAIDLTTYHYQMVEGVSTLFHITHRIGILTTTHTEPAKP